MRIALGVEYQGVYYRGWQRQQPQVATVQQTLEQALSKVANQTVELHCAGRTDAGVHATNQIVHFDTQAQRSNYSWMCGTNSHLPPTIKVRWAQPVARDFHARFSAISRRYHYIIYNAPTPSALFVDLVTWYYHPLTRNRMQQAANDLIGEHDFSAYRAAGCQARHAIRQVTHLEFRQRDNLLIMDIQANAFLHHMVRNIAGVLLAIGEGSQSVGWAKQVLLSKDRCQAGITAPAAGLYLVGVSYPDHYNLSALCYTPPCLLNPTPQLTDFPV